MIMKFTLSLLLFITAAFSQTVFGQSVKRSFFEIKVYHFENAEQENVIDMFLKDALIPALSRKGIRAVGVFKPIGNDTLKVKRVYVLTPFISVQQYADMPDQLEKDHQFKNKGRAYLEAKYNSPPYKRMESILLKAFTGMPGLKVPALKNSHEKRVYELRSYEAPTEQIFKNKVHMFNEGGEVALFKRLDFNAVFYGSVISGSHMPNLMYMTTFEDMASRDKHWKTFGSDPEWKKLSSMPQYQNNVSKIEVMFLRPTDYSKI